MAVNLIVLLVSLLVAGFIAVWIALPGVRPWVEMPKHRFLKRQQGFPPVERESTVSEPRASGSGTNISPTP